MARVTAGGDLATERRVLTPHERVEEALFTGLRLTEGIDLSMLRRKYGTDVWAEYGMALAPFVDARLVRHQHGRLSLSRDGMLVANEILQVFV